MKKCSKCGDDKELSEFPFRSKKDNTRQSYCKECALEYSRQHYKGNKKSYFAKNKKHSKKLKLFTDRYKQFCGCKICGEKRYWILEFHHIDPNEKELMIANQYKSTSMRILKNEIRKCIVLCANCHRDLHHKPN